MLDRLLDRLLPDRSNMALKISLEPLLEEPSLIFFDDGAVHRQELGWSSVGRMEHGTALSLVIRLIWPLGPTTGTTLFPVGRGDVFLRTTPRQARTSFFVNLFCLVHCGLVHAGCQAFTSQLSCRTTKYISSGSYAREFSFHLSIILRSSLAKRHARTCRQIVVGLARSLTELLSSRILPLTRRCRR